MRGIAPDYVFVDAHCHLHEYDDKTITEILKSQEIVIVAVSDDYQSSLRTISLAERNQDKVKPCLGLHPWSVHEVADPIAEAQRIVDLALSHDIDCLGEIGLDTKFHPETFSAQLEVFKIFVEAASMYDLVLNIHAAGTWQEVYSLLTLYRVKRALIHWYTGPISLIKDLASSGYYLSCNPALKIQRKHREAIRHVPLDNLLVESDGPYKYRGLELGPHLIPSLLEELSTLHNIDKNELARIIRRNASRLFKF